MNHRPKVTHITSSLKMGGAERVLYTLIKHLRTRFEQQVVYIHPGPFVEKVEQLGVRVQQVHGLVSTYDPFFFVRIYNAVKRFDPDILHGLLWVGHIASRWCGLLLSKPVINVYHNNIEQNGYVRNMLDRSTDFLCSRSIAVSDQVAQGLQSRFLHKQNAIEVVKNGIELSPADASIKKQDLGIAKDTFVIGAVGRFVPVKCFDQLIVQFKQIVQQTAHVHLILVGSGPLEDMLKKQIDNLGLTRKCTMLVNKPAASYYHLFDCLMQPSAQEGISLALLEAMSHGKPVIVTGENEQHPVIKHNVHGFVYPFGQHQRAVQYCMQLMGKKQVKDSMGRAAQRMIEARYQASFMIQQYEKIFREELS